mmetsp:Transcript_46986/g.102252  ORF Transcript_46986/g.102252 Transcript_46986/m.102252 type:complete len:200 (+) Transcript_46986:345-944(+)
MSSRPRSAKIDRSSRRRLSLLPLTPSLASSISISLASLSASCWSSAGMESLSSALPRRAFLAFATGLNSTVSESALLLFPVALAARGAAAFFASVAAAAAAARAASSLASRATRWASLAAAVSAATFAFFLWRSFRRRARRPLTGASSPLAASLDSDLGSAWASAPSPPLGALWRSSEARCFGSLEGCAMAGSGGTASC